MQRQPTRLFAIDSARGLGIILVVFGHAWRGAMGAGMVPDQALFRMIDAGIYRFHMPLFFFLSGLIFLDVLKKHDALSLFRGRVSRLLWPMALWTWLFFGIKLGAGAAANNPVTLGEFPVIPLPPYEHLWFLWALFLCQTLGIALYPFGKARNQTVVASVVGGAAVVMAILNPYTPVPSLIWGPMVQHLPHFLAGVSLGGLGIFAIRRSVSLIAASIFVGVMVFIPADKALVFTSLVLVILAWVTWVGIDQNSDTVGRALHVLRYLGRASMVIYLTHTVFSAALRIGLLKLQIDTLWVVVTLTTLIGLVAPLGVLWGAQKLRLAKVLGF
ncbi:MAG: acyltransferase [Sulfitobacter sp.]